MATRNTEREAEVAAQKREEHEALQMAKAHGFMDCRDIRDALGYDQPNPGTGEPYSSMGVAYRWIKDAGEEVVYPLEEDGRRITGLAYRSGCHESTFVHILEVKEAYYAALNAASQKSWDDAIKAKTEFDQKRAQALAALIARQDAATVERNAERAERYAQIDAARDLEIQRLMAEAEAADVRVIPDARRVAIVAALRTYPGPFNKNMLPKRKDLNAWAKFAIEGWEKRECWPEVQANASNQS